MGVLCILVCTFAYMRSRSGRFYSES